ncbi:MAG: hypothetical protein J0H63_11215 [Rhizobiales bacterium]|nr:hypothetical protein [Hyphomicrobiales bacterium]MBN9010665.1 hypothetical protein [Hyphomicrobiales bacterium]
MIKKSLTTILLASAIASAVAPLSALAASPVPCEQMLKQVNAAEKSAKLGDADKKKVADLKNQGLERCKADDDAGADDFFAQALKVMGK